MRRLISHLSLLLAAQVPLCDLAAQTAPPETVTVELSNFKFAPNELTLEHGRTYRLHLLNAGSGGHDFTAPEFFAASTIAPADQTRVTEGRIKLAGKASADVTLTPEKPGVYALRCSHFMHSGMGMSGHITVR